MGRKMPLACNRCGKELKPTGHATCKTIGCSNKFDVEELMKDKSLTKTVKCPKCGKINVFTPKEIVWTTTIVSRHRKRKHKYFDEQCFENRCVESKDDD
jgi:uncharacterized Zn finger protein